MFALVKPFLIAVAIIFVMFFLVGIIKIKKPDYSCLHAKKLRFAERTEILNVGLIHVYAFPLVADCPEGERYNPANVYKCGDMICQKDSDAQ